MVWTNLTYRRVCFSGFPWMRKKGLHLSCVREWLIVWCTKQLITMKQNSAVSNEKLQSDVISFLRFPLIIGVVMIHVGISTKGCESPELYNATCYLFQQILARIAVPMFFMFSGFLLFNKCVSYTPKIYLQRQAGYWKASATSILPPKGPYRRRGRPQPAAVATAWR